MTRQMKVFYKYLPVIHAQNVVAIRCTGICTSSSCLYFAHAGILSTYLALFANLVNQVKYF